MKLYENRNIKKNREARCGYCREEGHNVNTCPNVKDDYEAWQTYQVPINSPTLKSAYYFKNPKYWGEWYTKCDDAYHRQLAYIKRKEQPPTKRTTRSKAKVRLLW